MIREISMIVSSDCASIGRNGKASSRNSIYGSRSNWRRSSKTSHWRKRFIYFIFGKFCCLKTEFVDQIDEGFDGPFDPLNSAVF